MKKYTKDFRKLCTPASLYLIINVIIFIVIAIQNFGNTTQYCVGKYKCDVPNTFLMFLFKAIYILFWTFILNTICKAGYREVSWLMVLLPIMLLFVILGMVFINNGSTRLYEGFKEGLAFAKKPCPAAYLQQKECDDDSESRCKWNTDASLCVAHDPELAEKQIDAQIQDESKNWKSAKTVEEKTQDMKRISSSLRAEIADSESAVHNKISKIALDAWVLGYEDGITHEKTAKSIEKRKKIK